MEECGSEVRLTKHARPASGPALPKHEAFSLTGVPPKSPRLHKHAGTYEPPRNPFGCERQAEGDFGDALIGCSWRAATRVSYLSHPSEPATMMNSRFQKDVR